MAKKLIYDSKKDIVAESKTVPNKYNVIKSIDYFNLDATKQDIKDWQESRLTALDYDNPDWTDYIRVLDDVMVDAHLTGIISTIKDIVKSKEFAICDSSGKEVEEKKDIFEQEWFFKFIDYVIDGLHYPYSVIQLGNLKNDRFEDIDLVKREYFIPQHTFIKHSLYSFGMYSHGHDGWNISKPDFKPYFITVKSDYELGLLDKVAYHVLGKKHMLIYWWRYGEIFGLPTRIGKTDIKDPARRTNMESMVANMGNNLWAVVDPDDMIELVESSKNMGTGNVFSELLNYSNNEISKALTGSANIFDEKSFVGSVEVGERLFEVRQKSYLRKILFIINNQLIPRMIYYGLPLNGYYFKWINEDKVSYDQKLKAVEVLTRTFDLDPEEVGERLGYKLKPKQIQQQSVMQDINALYKDIPLPKRGVSERIKDYTARFMKDPLVVSLYPDENKRYEACQIQIKS